MSTNILINSRSMNGIITISDGSAILENGNLSCNNINSNNINLVGNTIQGLTSLSSSPIYPDSSTKISTTQFTSENFCDLTTSQLIQGEKTFSAGITTPLIKSIIANNIFFDFLNTTTTPIPTNSPLAGLSIGWNQQIFGETDLISYGAGDTNTGGFFFSCVNQSDDNHWLARYSKNGIIFYKELTIFSNVINNLTSLIISPSYPDSSTLLATTSFVSSNFCDLTTSQIINGAKTINNTLYFTDINYTDKCLGAFYLSNSTFIIDCKKITTSDLSNPENGSRVKFYVSPKIGNQSDLALMIQGTYGVSDPYSTQVYVSGALYVANFSYLNHINCGGNFTISASNSIIGLTSLTTSPTYPNSTTLIATTSFVSSNFVDKTSAQTIAGIKTFSNQVIITQPIITGLTSLSTSPIYPNSTSQIATTAFVSSNFCDLTTAQTIAGLKTFSNSIITNTITTTNRLITSYIETRTNNEILYNMYDAPTSIVPTTSLMGGYGIQYNNTGTGTLSITSYGGGGTSNTGGFEFSYLNSIISKTLISTFYPTQITFYKGLTISGTTITNLSNLTNNPVSTDNSTQIATTAFVNSQGFLTSTTANNTYCDLSNNQVINGTKTFTDFNVDTITLTYTTTPIYLQQEIGYTIYANGINNTTIPANLIDVTGTSITITAGTWLLEYNITIVPDTSLNYKIFVSGFSYSATSFTNVSGTGNSYFHNKASLTGQTITASYTINYSQIFYNSTGYKTIYLLALSSLNSGAGYYYNHNSSTFGVYDLPTSYIQATRIA